MKARWAPLVHGRTFSVDFRPNLIAVPHGFTQYDIEWAKKYILATFETFTTRGLEYVIRWSVFKNNNYCVVGMTCPVRLISEDMDKDEVGRPLTAFLGYVSGQQPFPELPAMDLAQFKGLYQLVRERWTEPARKADRLNEQNYTEVEFDTYVHSPQIALNFDPHTLALWPVNRNTDEQLWIAAGASTRPVSLCLGLPHTRIAQDGPFLNATTFDITQPMLLQKASPWQKSAPQPTRPDHPSHEQLRHAPPNHYRAGEPSSFEERMQKRDDRPNIFDRGLKWGKKRFGLGVESQQSSPSYGQPPSPKAKGRSSESYPPPGQHRPPSGFEYKEETSTPPVLDVYEIPKSSGMAGTQPLSYTLEKPIRQDEETLPPSVQLTQSIDTNASLPTEQTVPSEDKPPAMLPLTEPAPSLKNESLTEPSPTEQTAPSESGHVELPTAIQPNSPVEVDSLDESE